LPISENIGGLFISPQPYSELFMKILGIILLIIGLVGLYYGPYEIYCFYLFSSGGPFYYEGFQIGSSWFAYLTIQNAAYYVVAFLLLPIGIGTFKLQNWARKLSLNLLYIWIILGISIMSSFIFALPEFFKTLNLTLATVILLVMALFGIVIPAVLIKIYKSNKVKTVFKNKSENWIERIPQTILLVCSLNIIFILILHASTLFLYIFPLFGKFIFQRESVIYVTMAVFILAILTYGFWKKYFLAFYGLILYYGLMLISVIMTFSQYSLLDVIGLLNFPSYEQNYIIPVSSFLNFNLTALFGSFLVLTLLSIIYSRKYFHNTSLKVHK